MGVSNCAQVNADSRHKSPGWFICNKVLCEEYTKALGGQSNCAAGSEHHEQNVVSNVHLAFSKLPLCQPKLLKCSHRHLAVNPTTEHWKVNKRCGKVYLNCNSHTLFKKSAYGPVYNITMFQAQSWSK